MTLLSPGTRIVTRHVRPPSGSAAAQPAGAVGVIVKAPVDPQHRYRVRFVDGGEAALHRDEFELFTERHGVPAQDAPSGDALRAFVIYRCVVGSRAYGLAHDESDHDRRGIYLPPADLHWSLGGVPDQLEFPVTDECYWELQKFIVLALKANPNILECLYTPLVEHATPLAEELRAMRHCFLSRLVYQTYNGYVLSQFRKLEADLRNRGEVRWKHAMHLIRLLLAGIATLQTGDVPVHVEQHRPDLLAIRDGRRSWNQVNQWRQQLHGAFDAAYAKTVLPERPDYEAANALLLRARRLMVNG